MAKRIQEPKKRGPGRPWKNTPGSRVRSFRVTEPEYELLKNYLDMVRNGPRRERVAGKTG